MIDFPNAKINLGLNIISKRLDGYHNLESVFVPINWCDILEILFTGKEEFYLNGIIQNHTDRSNLVIKSLDLLRQDFDIPPVEIHLHKIIPMGAGLGGGSGDASFMLKLLNNSLELGLNTQELEFYAATLGSDCPFFIKNTPSFVTGRGEVLEELKLNKLSGLPILLINPQIHISTKEAFSGISPKKNETSLKDIISLPVKQWKELGLKNDFEASVGRTHPQILEIKQKLYDLGADYASMSGSGSTVFGIFENGAPDFELAATWISHKGKIL